MSLQRAALTGVKQMEGPDHEQLQSPQSSTKPEPGEAQGFRKLQKLSRKKCDVAAKKCTQLLLPPPKGLGRNMKEMSAAAYEALRMISMADNSN